MQNAVNPTQSELTMIIKKETKGKTPCSVWLPIQTTMHGTVTFTSAKLLLHMKQND